MRDDTGEMIVRLQLKIKRLTERLRIINADLNKAIFIEDTDEIVRLQAYKDKVTKTREEYLSYL